MKKKRPLSPHLQIYRWRWTMFFSISHRATGVILIIGMVYLCIKLAAFAFAGPEIFNYFFLVGKTLIFKVMKLIFAWAMLYHIGNGIRHLIWDAGKLFSLRYSQVGGYTVFILATAIWVYYLPTLAGIRIF